MKSYSAVLSSVIVAASLAACSGATDDGAGGTGGTSVAGSRGGTGGSLSTTGGSSGSGIAPTGGSSGTGDIGSMTPSADAGQSDPNACGEHRFDLVRKPAQLLLLLDRSGSMRDPPRGATGATKWEITIPAVNQAITETDTAVSWGMKAFPEGEGSSCSAGTVTNKIDVGIAAANASKVTAAVTALTPQGNGTPTGDAVKQAVAYLQSLPDSSPKYILLATDGDPSCPNNARPYAVQAIADAATAGVHTFVVGVATGDSSTTTLNDMALAGQEPRDEPNPLAPKYYLANSQVELVTALKQITGQVSNCIFTWATPPPVPSNIAVKIGGVKADQDPTNGWDYINADHLGVEVHGASCDKIKTTAGNQVEIVFGCPNAPIN